MSKIEAILFDMDGTLRDSREAIYSALEHALTVHTGRAPKREEMADYIHHHEEMHRAFAAEVDHKLFHDTYFESVHELIADAKLYDDVETVLAALQTGGYCLAIVSSTVSAQDYLSGANIAQYFDAVVGGNSTSKHKPDPEPVNLALQQLGVTADNAVMVGDLPADITAGKAAEVFATIALTHGFGQRSALESAGADYIIDALAELLALVKRIEQF